MLRLFAMDTLPGKGVRDSMRTALFLEQIGLRGFRLVLGPHVIPAGRYYDLGTSHTLCLTLWTLHSKDLNPQFTPSHWLPVTTETVFGILSGVCIKLIYARTRCFVPPLILHPYY